ncbi:MAG: anaerobic ribonucleoside-triphosphate reductase, partial [Bacteroidaceae bacterium]
MRWLSKLNIPLKMNKDFEKEFEKVSSDYGEDFEILNGFHESQLNFSDFVDGFVDKNVADVTIDANANASSKDIRSLMSEKGKSIDKLIAFNKIFYELKKKYGLKTAKEWLRTEYNGGFYLHDAPSSTFMPYCYAYDLTRLATEGLFFLKNYNAKAPNHLTTFIDDVIEYISYMSNRSSGAVGIPNILIWTYYFWKKDVNTGYCIKDSTYYIKQCFQKLIYRLNQPFMRIDQTAFVNVSIFDRNYLESLFGGVEYPDGTFAIDCIEDLIEHQKLFMEVVSETRTENMFTFPVLTYSLLYKDGKFVDEDFARWCSDHNTTWNDSNFFTSDNVGVLSNCCFDGSQKVLTKSSSGVYLTTFKELTDMSSDLKRNFTVFHNGSWVGGKLVKLPTHQMYKVTTVNKKEIIVTDNHLNPTQRGDIRTDSLTTDDYLLFSTVPLDTFPEKDEKLTYDHGFLIGMYLGDGSKSTGNNNEIFLSLNCDKYNASVDILNKAVSSLNAEANIRLGKTYNNVYPVTICNYEVKSFIEKWVLGRYCNEKQLNMECLLQSRDFRKGIVDGYYLTDGGNSNRIYTTSQYLVSQMESLFTSLGYATVIDETDRTDEPCIIRGVPYTRNYPLYCIRWYEPKNKRRLKDLYIVKNNSTYFKISSIEKYDSDSDFVYCFEMNNEDEPYFTLPNGIITHNCRLLSDTSKLDAFINSIGGTALSIGSVKVNTTNLMRIALESEKD